MQEEQQTLVLLRQVLLLAGALLLLLVAGVALLVTRQVITPVRLARRVAERIASGRLEERMHVSGEDDIARLAMSFNQMAEALQSQIRQLVELSRVQRRFVSDVSHELRTPLTTVRMAGDVLHDARGSFDPMTARSAELLQKELDRFEHLLSDLLEISRFDAGAAVLDLEDSNLADVVHRVVAATAPMALHRGVTVTIRDEGVFMAEADERRVERIVRNLVVNAIDHADSDGVSVRLATDGHGDCPHRPRPRSRAAARTVRDGLQPVLASRPGACPDHRGHRPGPGHRARGRAAARRLAPGLGYSRRWRAVPADAPAPGRRPAHAQPAAVGPRRHPRGSHMSPARGPVVFVVLALCALVSAGCATLPESGAVHTAAADRPDRPQDAPYFNPPGPVKDASPSAIVNGFMVAMQANPLSTSVARTFLSERARRAWQPNRGTVVYDAFEVQQTRDGANVRLADIRRLDARGGWRGGSPGASATLDTRLVSERGQWRIDNPPDALVVPTSFFDRSFARFNLYFYDQTGRTLLPDPVFIPRGEQTATNLVRGLLTGAGRGLAPVTRSALPSRTDLDLSVVVTESGVAEVPLSREILQVSVNELDRAADQLAWTLRQVPGITRVRITAAGAPVPLRDGQIDVPVTSGEEFDAGGAPRRSSGHCAAAAWSMCPRPSPKPWTAHSASPGTRCGASP